MKTVDYTIATDGKAYKVNVNLSQLHSIKYFKYQDNAIAYVDSIFAKYGENSMQNIGFKYCEKPEWVSYDDDNEQSSICY